MRRLIVARGKYLSLEEARKQKRLDRFCKENPSGFPRVLGMGCVVSLDMGHAEGLKPPQIRVLAKVPR